MAPDGTPADFIVVVLLFVWELMVYTNSRHTTVNSPLMKPSNNNNNNNNTAKPRHQPVIAKQSIHRDTVNRVKDAKD